MSLPEEITLTIFNLFTPNGLAALRKGLITIDAVTALKLSQLQSLLTNIELEELGDSFNYQHCSYSTSYKGM